MLPIGNGVKQVQAVRRGQGKSDLLILAPATEQWLRHGYAKRMATEAVRRDLGEMLAHGEPETGMGQGEAAELAIQPPTMEDAPTSAPSSTATAASAGNGAVAVDFGELGPSAA